MLLPVSFFLSEAGVSIFTSCVDNFSKKWGREWGGVNVEQQFPASFGKYFETNQIF